MRLTRLDIKGFKSFAEETVINFNEDVIGIVGPNGSGKSNIVDAIRWVLGEQKSKELRLEKMSNVIFNGTRKRRPGAIAQVALTFENTRNLLPTEFQTVTISRLLYRSGESEYRINEVPCRLKDITSLFLDTGIGSNSYAIIALGMVDDILSDKNDARRNMFEQAAGISKYKKRKHETFNKLKNTEEDLDRVEDLLYEIEGNLKSLEKQAKRAQRYFNLKKQYRDLSVDLAILQLAGYRDRYKEIKQKITEEEDRLRQMNIEARESEARLEAEKKANLDKEKALTDRQRELNAFLADIRQRENEKNMLGQRVQYLKENLAKEEKQIEEARRRTGELEERLQRYHRKRDEEKKEEEALKARMEEARMALESVKASHGSLKSDLDSFLSRQQEVEKSLYQLERDKAIQQNQLENQQQELQRLLREEQQRREETEGVEGQLRQLEEERKGRLEKLTQLQKEEEDREAAVLRLEKEVEELRREVTRVNRRLDANRNEYKLTKSMIESMEGFPESIKFLSRTKKWDKETPLLSDLIYCQEAYRAAIETYLEPFLNYYVVESVQQAREAIQLLGEAQKGKAHFFVLDALRDYQPVMQPHPDPTLAVEVVQTDPPYRKLIDYLLRNVVITDQEELPREIGAEELIVLARSGRFVQRPFSLSGGSVGLFEGKKIGRKKNLELLEKEIDKAEEEERLLSSRQYSLTTELEKLKGAGKRREIEQVRESVSSLDQRKATLMTRLENAENFSLRTREKKARLEESMVERRQAISELDQSLQERQASAEQVRREAVDKDSSYREVAEKLSEASTFFNEQQIAFIRQQNRVESLQQEVNFLKNQLEETHAQIQKTEAQRQAEKAEQQRVAEKLESLANELLELYRERKKMESFLSEAEQKYYQARQGINEQEDELRRKNRRIQDSQSLLSQLKDRFNDVKLEISSIGERLRIEFSLSVNELLNREPQSELPQEQLQEKVDRLKHRLDTYGEINPMAVEAYEEMKERYDSISGQREDILEAKKSLEATIQEIEETATRQFLEAFDKVQQFFREVFRSLFTENDDCDLVLLEAENPLESPIEIIARPKGKRPQSISQLSGGEKTLTATALLFALYLLKPAPFCIFDEVDAPLDDANIEKFNRIIKKFSADSQFVIVTHNKQTMAAVDVIYGVYMQEEGVSNVSAVDFRALEHSSLLETVGNPDL